MLLKSEDGYFRDWRGLWHLSGIEKIHYEEVSKSDDKINKIIKLWEMKHSETGQVVNIYQFLQSLETIDRYDVCDDIYNSLGEFLMNDDYYHLIFIKRASNFS
jgi:myeloid differentiation primary response protein MyD88